MTVPEKAYADDMAVLGDLTEESLLHELKRRYERNIIYTYLGDVLLAVNPNKMIPIYGEEVGLVYSESKLLKDLSPHIYAIASKAYRNLIWERVNQAILVSGESGAGKTESTKMTLAQLARMSKSEDPNKLAEQIVEVNPLLEAFGNAKTTMNDNSSRFGKLIEVMFEKRGKIIGAKVTEHMLEKSRVVHCGNGERSFHIFYNMFAGLTEYERDHFYLGRPEHYRITDPGHGAPVFLSQMDYDKNRNDFEEWKEAMSDTGFSPQIVDLILAIMAGILHLSNIDFAQDPELQQLIIVNEEEVDYGSRLLSLQAEDLVTVLLATSSFIRGERIVKLKSVNEACDGRDALCKTLYSRIFSWVVKRINEIFRVQDYDNRPIDAGIISILDMAGFEKFQFNSFEQLCINSANEQLQSFFNTYIFSWELQEYHIEGIRQPKIKFTSNSQVLGLFFDRPVGVFAILEDECRLQTSTDVSFVDHMNKEFGKNDVYKRCKSRDPVFTIEHYAGQVTYNAFGFLEKNRETLGVNFISLMQNSHNWLINEIFDDRQDSETSIMNKRHSQWNVPERNKPNMPALGPGETLSKRAGKKLKERTYQNRPLPAIPSSTTTTTSVHFRNSLASLMEQLKASEPQFVRCIRANTGKQFGLFDAKLVQNQLRYTGVFETTRIRKLGFPTRLYMQDFINRYKAIGFPVTEAVETTAENCEKILHSAYIHGYEIGKTKVFLKYWHVDHLNMCLENFISNLRVVQTTIQMYLARSKFLEMLKYINYCKDQVFTIGNAVTKTGDQLFHILVSTNDLDKQHYRQRLAEEEERRRQNTRQSLFVRRGRGLPRSMDDDDWYNAPDYGEMEDSYINNQRQSEYYDRPRSQYRSQRRPSYQIIEESLVHLYRKWDSVDPDAWCKILYLEKDKVVQKFYILEREVTIDGKVGSEFDGERISLSYFRNEDRDDETASILTFVGQGVKLRKDMDGSITATRLTKNPVIVKDHDNPSEHCFSLDVINNEGRLPHHVPVKIFDMEEYKCQMGIQMKCQNLDDRILRHQSVTCISLVKDEREAGDTPCWLVVINLCALRAITDPNVRTHVEQKLAELANRTEEELEEELEKQEKSVELAARHKQKHWSKLNQRKGLEGSEAPMRKTKFDLMKKDKKIGDNLHYSWEIEAQKSKFPHHNVEYLHEHFDEPESHIGGYRNSGHHHGSVISSMMYPGTGSSVRRDWAKVKVAIKLEKKMDEEKLQEIAEEDEQ
ncbi:unconventional myosin-Ic-like [Crassostrea virginica]|uniref:Myosin-IIIa-like isoform X1 n=2 Tax=Crassostrea virginica TaxID=6565 RepID=A0A8B8CYP4_CRAVI|nr:myosin-IIIa-like isoform X1 [Crassostrea virginica]